MRYIEVVFVFWDFDFATVGGIIRKERGEILNLGGISIFSLGGVGILLIEHAKVMLKGMYWWQ